MNHQFRDDNHLVCLNIYLDQKGWLTICGPFVPHQRVSGVVIQPQGLAHYLWPLCAPSGCKWCGHFNNKAWLTICGLFVSHQYVSGVVISTTRPDSPFVASFCPIRE
jgi:hypothetical protein